MWAHVFQCLVLNNQVAVVTWPEQNVAKVLADQACFHQLKLVCSKFRNVFALHPEFSNEPTISKPTAHTFVPSVLLWTQRWGSFICKFNSFFGEQPHKLLHVLGVFICICSSLKSMFLTTAPSDAVRALPIFSSLVRCKFHDHLHHLVSSALKRLPRLKDLYLTSGQYSNVPSAGCLTRVSVLDSVVQFSASSLEGISLSTILWIQAHLVGYMTVGWLPAKLCIAKFATA